MYFSATFIFIITTDERNLVKRVVWQIKKRERMTVRRDECREGRVGVMLG